MASTPPSATEHVAQPHTHASIHTTIHKCSPREQAPVKTAARCTPCDNLRTKTAPSSVTADRRHSLRKHAAQAILPSQRSNSTCSASTRALTASTHHGAVSAPSALRNGPFAAAPTANPSTRGHAAERRVRQSNTQHSNAGKCKQRSAAQLACASPNERRLPTASATTDTAPTPPPTPPSLAPPPSTAPPQAPPPMEESPTVAVSFGTRSAQIPLTPDAALAPLRSRAISTLAPENPSLVLAFETPSNDRAAVSTDFAFKLVLGAHPSAGRLVLVPAPDLPTVDQCMTTVLRAVVDTATRSEAAAVFLALSGTWHAAARDLSDCPTPLHPPVQSAAPQTPAPSSCRPRASSSPSPSPSSSSPSSSSSALDLRSSLTRTLERAVPHSSRALADAACSLVQRASDPSHAAAESRAVASFCTHTGVSCSACNVQAIQGTRYRCSPSVNLCERCRRALPEAASACFTVYDHPWEASDDYAESCADILRAPTPPLGIGDVGPRVMHLQYVLYKVGYLNVCCVAFRAGLFCSATRDAISVFEYDFRLSNQHGVYTALIRSVLLSLFDEVERRYAGVRCSDIGRASNTRFRTAMAA